MKYTVIIPAAGLGARMNLGYNKVLLNICDQPVIKRTVQQFVKDPYCQAIHLAVRQEEVESMTELFEDEEKVVGIHVGGKERQDSIYNALVNVEAEYIFVHDGARPLVDQAIIARLKDKVVNHPAVICGVKTKDTLKRVANNEVTDTLDREEIISVHTPQAFKGDLLKRAYEHARARNLTVTDDSMMVEALGQTVFVTESSYDNIKLTTIEDVRLAEMILGGKTE